MLRFVVLHHTGVEQPHFDLMFERDSSSLLTTLRCPRWPIELGDELHELSEHRRVYLDFEGPVSDARGFVKRVVAGHIESHELVVDPPSIGLRLRLVLASTIEVVLVQISLADDLTAPGWRVVSIR